MSKGFNYMKGFLWMKGQKSIKKKMGGDGLEPQKSQPQAKTLPLHQTFNILVPAIWDL